jgi:Effector Associated Constant Component 1
MGGGLEAIKLVVDEGFQVANFAIALLSWRATRSKRPEVTIKRGGVELSLAKADPEAIEEIVAALSPDVQ